MNKRRMKSVVFLLFFLSGFWACLFQTDETAGNPGEETTNGVVFGYAMDKNENLQQNIPVYLRTRDYMSKATIPAKIAAHAMERIDYTDENGYFKFDSLPSGDYRIQFGNSGIGGSGGYAAVSDARISHLTDTVDLGFQKLYATVTIKGILTTDFNAHPLGIKIFGLEAFTLANKTDGMFTLSDVPAGVHDLRILPSSNIFGSRVIRLNADDPGKVFHLDTISMNLVQNGDFENEPFELDWLKEFENAEATYVWDKAVYHTGAHSGMVHSHSTLGAGVKPGHKILIEPGVRYHLEAWLKTEDVKDKGAWIWSAQWDSTRSRIDKTRWDGEKMFGTRGWTRYSYRFTAEKNARALAFYAFLNGRGKMWIDDVVLKRED